MAFFTRTNGDSAQVAVYDTGSYVNGTSSGTVGQPVQPQGPKLAFYTGDLGTDPSAQFGPGGAIEAVLRVFQELSTVYIYQFNADGTYRIGAYPTSGDSAATLQTNVQALGTVNGYALAGATVALATFA